MKLTVCSIPEALTDEQQLVQLLFESGLTCFHLRKPMFSKDELRNWLKQLTTGEQRMVVLHSHWALAEEFNLKGLHFGASVLKQMNNEEQLYWWAFAKGKKLTISSSVHNQLEIERLPSGLDYVWLSPVFESISKTAYAPEHTALQFDNLVKELREKKKTQVFALGGVKVQYIEELTFRGFDGAVVLGAIWSDIKGLRDKELIKQRIQLLITSCKTIPTS